MAALNRRNPNLDDFVGLNWSCWVDRANISPPDAGSNAEDGTKCGRNPPETMTLRKEDMHTYGHCPAHDDFYLVVCGLCGQVVKPEAFERHCERRHGPLPKTCGRSSSLAPQQRPRPGRSPSTLPPSGERQRDGRHREGGATSSAAPHVHQHRPSKAQREAASLPAVEKSSQENPPLARGSSSTPRPRVPPWHSGPLPPGPGESPSSQRGTRTYSRVHKNVDKKECGPNKDCGDLDPESKKLVSSERVCNTDSIQQQKALGRAQTFDQLAAEKRTTPAGQDTERPLVKLKDKGQHLEAFEEKITTQGRRYNFSSNCHILRSRDPQESFPEEEGNGNVEVEVQPPYPFNQSLLSSGESEDDEQEETADLPASTWHPKPLGLCTFGCRTMGCSIFTFDRRLHHLRFALSAMLEHHVSTHLWKKMPQVSSGLRSCPVAPTSVRTAARPSQSAGSLSLESTSLEQPETKTSQHNSPSTKPPSSASSGNLGPGRWRSPVGRVGKARPKGEATTQGASVTQKASRMPRSTEDKSSKYIRDPPLNEKGQPHIPSSQGPIGGTLSHGKKPCPPLPLQPSERHLSGLEKRSALPAATHRSPRGRATSTGLQRKMAGCDHKGRGQKRRGGSEPPTLSASLSRTSKCKRLSSPSRSSLVAWKGENINI